MKRWYVVQTKRFKEGPVSKLLSKADIEIFSPTVEQYIRTRQSQFYKQTPFFPCYLFCHIDFDVTENIHLIKYTRGVTRILGNAAPIAIAEDMIDLLKRRVKSRDSSRIASLDKGDCCKVKRGLLKDLIGMIHTPPDAHGRVRLLLRLVNYNMAANLHWSEIEKIPVLSSSLATPPLLSPHAL